MKSHRAKNSFLFMKTFMADLEPLVMRILSLIVNVQ